MQTPSTQPSSLPVTALVSSVVLAECLHDPAVRLLDVRTAGEYEAAHIRGAYNVPLDLLGEHAAELQALDTPVVLICQSGQRARRAEAMLMASGLRRLHVLDGGIQGWIAAGLPLVRGRGRLSLERQVRMTAGALAAAGGLLALVLDPWFALVPTVIGSGLVFAGVTDTCGMAMLLARLPYNRPSSCDTAAVVKALREGAAPTDVATSARANVRAACGSCR